MGKGIKDKKKSDGIEIENEGETKAKKSEKVEKIKTTKPIKKLKTTHLDEEKMEVEAKQKKIRKKILINPEEKTAVIFKEFIQNSEKIPDLKSIGKSDKKISRGKRKRADKKIHYMKKKLLDKYISNGKKNKKQSLNDLSSLKNNLEEIKMEIAAQTKVDTSKGVDSSQKNKVNNEEVERFNKILKFPAFLSNPLSTIKQHIINTQSKKE